MPIELRHWRAFVAAAKTQHFGTAAEHLGISQPALSQLIQTLEATLGTTLFDRRGRRARLNEAGHRLLPEARAALEQVQRAACIGSAAGRQAARALAGGYVGSASFHPCFTALISAIGAARPPISLRLDQGSATTQIRHLADHLLDFGIARSPIPPLDPVIASVTLARERMVMALSADHPKAATDACNLADFADEKFIQYIRQPSGGLRALTASACRSVGFEPKIVHTVPQIATMLCLVGAGAGVALVPETMARLGIPGVVCRTLVKPIVTDLMLLHRRSDTSPALRALLRLSRQLTDKISLSN